MYRGLLERNNRKFPRFIDSEIMELNEILEATSFMSLLSVGSMKIVLINDHPAPENFHKGEINLIMAAVPRTESC